MRSKSKISIVAGGVCTLVAITSSNGLAAEPSGADPRPMAGQPDNSDRNVRDRDDGTLTPTDQSNAPADIEMTQKIRKGITSNDAMSVQARNIKIITQRGVVTLRGPVKTTQEKAAIETLAKNAGATRIDNQLEIDRDVPSGEKG